jgi:hypothetical protein
MNPSRSSTRRRHFQLAPECLESRALMTGGAGDTFAIVPGTIANPGGTISIPITLDPSHFTMPKGKITIGVDIVPASGSSFKGIVRSVTDPHGNLDSQAFHSIYDPHLPRQDTALGKGTTAMLVPISTYPNNPSKPVTYEINVEADFKTSGAFLLGFYLPGDANGTGTVNAADVQLVKSIQGSKAGSAKYNFNADTNRDGRIGPIDLAFTKQNLGASTNVTPVVTANLDPASDSGLQDRITAIRTVHFTGTATPGATITYSEINNLTPSVTTTADSLGNYSLMIPLGNGSNTFQVTSVDAFGQTITGTIAAVTYNPNAPALTA